jgi:hypothetical protein
MWFLAVFVFTKLKQRDLFHSTLKCCVLSTSTLLQLIKQSENLARRCEYGGLGNTKTEVRRLYFVQYVADYNKNVIENGIFVTSRFASQANEIDK